MEECTPCAEKATVLHAGKVQELHTAGVNFQNHMEKTAQLLISLDFMSVTLVISHSGLFDPAPLHLPITNQQQRFLKTPKTNGLLAVRHLVGSPNKPPERKQTNHKTILFNGDYCRF